VLASATPEAAWSAFARELAREGLNRLHCQLDLPRDAANPFAPHEGARHFGLFWDETLDAAVKNHEGDIRRAAAPELRHIRQTLLYLSRFRTPFFIDHHSTVERSPGSPFAPICRTMLEDLGQHHALVLPIADPASGRLSTLTVWIDEPRPDFPAFVRARAEALQMGGLYLRSLIALRWPGGTPAEPQETRLSERERQVLAALAGGAQVAAIAARLKITERSVQEYLSRARVKLGARTRTEAVVRALLDGLI
jgi:DNA-binding CsgD family transcriptional regulator